MNNNAIKSMGIESISKAIELDGNDAYDDAFKLYVHGVGQLLVAIKYEKNNKSKDFMLTMVNGYITRAEMLKSNLNKKTNKKNSPSPIPGQNPNPSANPNPSPNPTVHVEPSSDDAALQNNINSTMIDANNLNVTWDDVAGLDKAKETIKEAVILPLRFPKLYTGSRKPWKGILLYGPPGTGKSFLAKAVASESKSTFFSVSSSDLISKYQGESERAVKILFDTARKHAPSVIFIDEIDSIAGNRTDGEQDSLRRVKTEFLVQMQGVNGSSDETKRLLVLGATNTPWTLDPAFRRRFEKRIFIPLPDINARSAMIGNFMKDTDHNINADEYVKLGKMTENYSGSDISVVLRDALMAPIRKCQGAKQFTITETGKWTPVVSYPSCSLCPSSTGGECGECGVQCVKLEDIPDPSLLEVPVVEFHDVVDSIKRNSSSVSNFELGMYADWTKKFGQDGC